MDHVYLQGSEDVRAAGSAMREAAATMREAASQIESSLFMHRQFLDRWLDQARELVTELIDAQKKENRT